MQALRIAGFMPTLFKAQFWDRIDYPTSDFSGQTVIVTGSNTGLGKEAARHIARLGASKVILGVRTVSKGEEAAKDIVKSCNIPESNVEVWQLDIADTHSIKSFAKRAQGLERLDAVIENAGQMTSKFNATQDGIEGTIATNVIGTILLALLLLPKLRQTGQRGRLTVVGSDMMYMANPSELETSGSILVKINDSEQSKPWMSERYALSKILVYWTLRDVAARSPSGGPIITAVTPGLCQSDLLRESGGLPSIANGVARTTEVGGRTLVHAVSPELEGCAHGKFLMNAQIGADGMNVTSAQGQRLAKKWNEEVFRKLEELSPGCLKVLQT